MNHAGVDIRTLFPKVQRPCPAAEAAKKRCPVCDAELRGSGGLQLSNAEVNAHVDACLASFSEA